VARPQEFWPFATDLYGRPGVAQACLWLQDNAGLDVVMVLFCCWLGRSRGAVEPEGFAALLDGARQWSAGLVTPLRQGRRWYREQTVATFDGACYNQLKAAELAAERAQMAWLETCASGALRFAAGPGAHASAANCALYLTLAELALDQEGRRRLAGIIEQS